MSRSQRLVLAGLATTTQKLAPPPLPLLRAGKETEIEVKKGDTVRFRVRQDAPVHRYGISKDIEAELEHSGQEIGSLKVEPR